MDTGNLVDTGNPSDTGDDTNMCVPMPEICNGVSDDCDDDIDEDTCAFPNTQATCEAGECEVTSCDTGFLDCSDAPGCETAWDRTTCGSCDMACGVTEGCRGGVCVEPTFDWSWTVNEGTGDYSIFIASGLEQRYLLTKPAINGSAPVQITSSTGAPFSVSVAGRDASVLVAMDDSGTELWQVRLTAETLNTVALRSIDGVDGVFIAGDFQGTLEADGPAGDLTMTSGTNRDGFVLQVDALGGIRRIAQITDRTGSDEFQNITDMAVAPDGVVFVIGTSRGDFATTRGGLSVLDTVPSGVFRFLLRIGGRGAAIETPGFWESVTADNANVYLGTRLEGRVTLGGTEYMDNRFAPLVASFDRDLELRWVQAPLAAGPVQGEDELARVHAGNGVVYLSHTLDGMHMLGGHAVDGGGYVAALSPADGTIEWARALGATTPAIGTDGSGDVYFGGSGTGTVDLGGGSLGAAVGRDALVGVLQASGAYESARRFGGLDRVTALEVHPTTSGIMVAGRWSGTMTVDGQNFGATDSQNLFVLHFSTATGD